MIPGDDQMDQLLRTFFDREVPADLGTFAFGRSPEQTSPELTIVSTQAAPRPSHGKSRGLVVISVVASLAACIIAAIAVGPQSNQQTGSGSMMPVSSQGTRSDAAVGDDRTSLEEIDSIEIKGPSSNR